MPSVDAVIDVRHLTTCFNSETGTVKAVSDLSFHINSGEMLGIVGESGCGKSVTSLSIMRLIPSPPGYIKSGQILLDGIDLLQLSETEMRSRRGNDISMIFQEPMTSLNPVLSIGKQLSESYMLHQGLSRKDALHKAVELLHRVSLANPEKRIKEYPHQLSGGMRQRVMIAMALACNPRLLIADEPTTALDVTVQAQILSLISDLQKSEGLSVALITHDLGVVAENCSRIIVMYAGRKIEEARTQDLFAKPLHPYTQAMLKSIPQIGQRHQKLYEIEGNVPSLANLPAGCAFSPRCPHAVEQCHQQRPDLVEYQPQHWAACHRAAEIKHSH